jgi:DNA-binding MarR family transcriptional regulator/GNAT superfamily N-acetyltransferase
MYSLTLALMTTIEAERVTAVRAFTRFYTTVVGALDEGLLRSAYTLTEARLIFELGQRDTTEVPDLRRMLDLDAGYLSRILTRFEDQGLVTRQRSGADARRQVIRLTPAGRQAYAMLDARSAEQVKGLIGGLSDENQRRLVGAMGMIERLLGNPPRLPAYVIRPPRPGDLGWVVQRHGVLYAQEYGWDQTFEALVARIVASYVDGLDPRRSNAWIAEVDAAPAGCVFCVPKDAGTAQLRLLLVEPSARGMGIGVRLVDECIRFARTAGYRSLTLWTNDVLVAARRIYERAGFRLVEEEKHHSFGHDLVGQNWVLDLSPRNERRPQRSVPST